MKEKLRERLPIIEWPDIERRMAIISRMTSEPPRKVPQKDATERTDLKVQYSGDSPEIKSEI
ncbi:MAG: hypothetical protein ACFFDQ_04820 [Candidatus Thorarchaeota archaeon]